MIRKSVLVAMSVALPVALLVTVGRGIASGSSPRPAAFPAVTFNGNVSCNLQGALTITPPATISSIGPYNVTFHGVNNKCVGLFGTSLTLSIPATGQIVTLKKSIESFSYTVPASPNAPGALCQTLLSGGPSPVVPPFPINWFGSGGIISPTVASFPLGGNILPGLMTWVNGPASGTFTGTIDIFLGYNIVTVASDCALASGLTTLPMNHLGGDNLMVGPAF
jgi:hypothetical protein